MPRPRPPTLLLVTPYLADANNGNWRTAARWARLLAPDYRVIVQAATQLVTEASAADAVAMVALHARRSHAAIASWRAAYPDRALLVTMTGTDLYRDLPAGDHDALASIKIADRVLVLQDDAIEHLPVAVRAKARVVYQSARTLTPWPRKRSDRLHCALVAHLRPEKDPATAFAAWRRLAPALPITLTIVGAGLDAPLARAASELEAADARVRWLGPRTLAWTRQAIKRAHLLIVPSLMEGGSNVVVEAVTAGTALLASRMSGNVGMLGADYPGYFEVGDAAGLAALAERALVDRAFLADLEARCRRRAARFAPAAEARLLRRAIGEAIRSQRGPGVDVRMNEG
ncbi:MAG: TIGR04348 family glycosyltransferase [Burkholderiales bacterium]|nr:TIGR04348 family glycosyltransferase [Burkholderiales bacterium]